MLAPPQLVHKVVCLRLSQSPVGDRCVHTGTRVAGHDLAHDGLEGIRVARITQPLGLLGSDPASRHHAIELPEYPLLIFTWPVAAFSVSHDHTLAPYTPRGYQRDGLRRQFASRGVPVPAACQNETKTGDIDQHQDDNEIGPDQRRSS
jgi:hypothetical protein